MIRVGEIGKEDSVVRVYKRFQRADIVFKINGLVVKLNTSSPKHVYGLFYVPPLMREEAGNFAISKELQSHPYWDYVDIPQGPQITWFAVENKFRNRGISTDIYEGLIQHFGALYSDHSQTVGGTAIWKALIKKTKVNVYAIQWRKKDWKIVSITKQTSTNLEEYFAESDVQTILVAVPFNKAIKEFKISDAEESIQVAYR